MEVFICSIFKGGHNIAKGSTKKHPPLQKFSRTPQPGRRHLIIILYMKLYSLTRKLD